MVLHLHHILIIMKRNVKMFEKYDVLPNLDKDEDEDEDYPDFQPDFEF